MKLTSTLLNLIIEGVSYGTIYEAIQNRKVLVIYYDGDEPGGKGMRLIEPVCLGKTFAGNMALRAWDYEGVSHTAYLQKQPLPGWRIFRLDKIISATPSGYVFNEVRPNYNTSGDKKFKEVFINAKFGDIKEPLVEPQPTAPEKPSGSWIQRIKDKFKNVFSKFVK